MTLLKLENLTTHFDTPRGTLRAVDGFSLEVNAGETVVIVGESGCGKSVTSMSILGLVPPATTERKGNIWFEGKDLLGLSEKAMREIRGNKIGMIFQEPMTSLNPVLTIGRQIGEALRLHRGLSRRASIAESIKALAAVGIPAPERRVYDYPHQLSGGMRQRVGIAMALACNPSLLIADEPTTALDVTIQAQILDLLRQLNKERGTAILLITHDLGVVAEMADRVVVMYAGRKVEEASAADIFKTPRHPYTRGLMKAVPRIGSSVGSTGRQKLSEIPGIVPSLVNPMPGCAFAGRCPMATDICLTTAPELRPASTGHFLACHHGDKTGQSQ